MMIERGTPDTWHSKRDDALRQPRHAAIRTTATGIPYLAPANVLLFKAKHHRPKDEGDFRRARPALTPRDCADVRLWLTTCHPGHPWLAVPRRDGVAAGRAVDNAAVSPQTANNG